MVLSRTGHALRSVFIGLSLSTILLSPVLAACSTPENRQSIAQREIAKYQEQLKEEPDDISTLSSLANLYLQDGQYGAAIRTYNLILELQPDDLGALTGTGIAYLSKGDRARARDSFLRVLELTAGSEFERVDKRVEMAHFYLGTMAVDDREYEQAVDHFNRALTVNRADADTLYMLGKALRGQEQFDEAIEVYTRAVALVPDFVEVYKDMADVYGKQGKIGEKSYATGMAALFENRYDQALDSLQQATVQSPGMADAWFGLGYAWEKKGNAQQALNAYAEAIRIDPNNLLANQGMRRLGGGVN